MPKPRVLILRAPGTNCDVETAFAFETAGGLAQVLHINRVLENPQFFSESQVLCLPGGFSYGDDVAAGRILANQICHHLTDALQQFRADEKLILGICNGFQVLVKAGMLLAKDNSTETMNCTDSLATLTWNDSGVFEDRWVQLAASGDKSPLLRGIDSMYLPVAHAEGKFVTRSQEVLRQLEAEGQLVLRLYRSGISRGQTSRLSPQPQWLPAGGRRPLRRDRPGPGIDAPPGTSYRPHPASPLDAGRSGDRGRWSGNVSKCRRLFQLSNPRPKTITAGLCCLRPTVCSPGRLL